MQQSLFSFSLLLLFLHCTRTVAQAPAQSPAATPAKAPTSPSTPIVPTDTISVLLKAGHFITFARLMKATHVDTQLFAQLNSSTDGITMFAPNEDAFSKLRAGALDSLTDREKLSFVQFHILPRFLSPSDFQTLSNPVKTLAGADSRFPLTITTSDNSVTLNTGLSKTNILNTTYTDKQVAIYEIGKVLIPKDIFPPAPAPAPTKPVAESSPVVPKDASGAVSSVVHYNALLIGLGILAAVFSL